MVDQTANKQVGANLTRDADPDPDAIGALVTLRDWLRYGVSRFNAASLVYGHGTASAIDEAAFLLLSALDLDPDTLDPWLDARLTQRERRRCRDLIEQRILTRKPAPYLVGHAWIKGYRFAVDERVIVPRSYIGELIVESPDVLAGDIWDVARVLDLCTGSGCLAILAALRFENALVDAVDVSPEALSVARTNIADYGLEGRIRAVESDLFAALAGQRYDLIISNPPYVTTAAVEAFPPEYRAEPQVAHLGGADGLDVVRRLLGEVGGHLNPGGTLVVEVGAGRQTLEEAYPSLPFLWLDTAESEGEVFILRADDLSAAEQGTARRTLRRS